MADRPILFSAPMIHAIQREIEQPGSGKTQTRRLAWKANDIGPYPMGGCAPDLKPASWQKIEPGDRFWVREAWFREYPGKLYYAADGHPQIDGRWKPNIHMFRHDSRFTLLVINRRVERLQDISGLDAAAEGMNHPSWSKTYAPRAVFADVWDSLNKPGALWADNPEVVVVTFRPVACNIDNMNLDVRRTGEHRGPFAVRP